MKTKSLRDFSSALKRREFLEKQLKINLENISEFNFSEDEVFGKNIENLIGSTQIPLGVAGPLKLHLLNPKPLTLNSYLPLSTTEGALVASISRGCKAIFESGGAKIFVEEVGQTRGPVFKVKNLEHGFKTKKWIEDNLSTVAKASQSNSSHLKLLKVRCQLVGKDLFVRFSFSTDDAMGMNMVTFSTYQAARLIEQKTQARLISLAGNFDIDKKPAFLNFLEGRGKKVWAEVVLPKKVIQQTLKTTSKDLEEIVLTKTHLGSIMSGSLGFNAHFANIISALFIATGQDPAHVVEGSLGITTAEKLENGDLYFSVYLPSLVVGTIGGGTSLPSQKAALQIMQVSSVLEYAQVAVAAVLAGELSLLASLSEGSLVKAHKRLGRKEIK